MRVLLAILLGFISALCVHFVSKEMGHHITIVGALVSFVLTVLTVYSILKFKLKK